MPPAVGSAEVQCGAYSAPVADDVLRLDELVALCDRLRECCWRGAVGDVVRAEVNPERDALLREYRALVNRRVRDDARLNLRELQSLAGGASGRCGFDIAHTPVGADAFRRLRGNLGVITDVDPYADGDAQDRWWFALHEFYLGGLWLADRLLSMWQKGTGTSRSSVTDLASPGALGASPLLPRPANRRRWQRVALRPAVPGLAGHGWLQTLVNVGELNFPNVFRLNPVDTYLPTMLHLLAHHLFPRKPWRFNEMFETALGWVRRGCLGRIGGVAGPAVTRHGIERVRNEHLFNTRTWRTRHNVIFACAHRFGFLDIPLFFPALRGIRLGIWADNSFYGPGVERKIVRDRYSIAIRGRDHPSFRQSILDTVDILVRARRPVFIMVDGGQPPLFTGQQMSVKDGVRLAARAAVRASVGTGRRTYVVPVSLNDPAGFVQGRQQTMRVTFHRPILVEAGRRRRPRSPGSGDGPISEGDPLVNHLEALFLLETTHAEQGLPQPRIVAAARRRLRQRHREPLLKRRFQTSLADLAFEAGQRGHSTGKRGHSTFPPPASGLLGASPGRTTR